MTYKGLYKYNYQIKNFGKVILDEDNSFNNDDIKVNCITRDENDNIWIGTAGSGLIHWNNAREKPEKTEIGIQKKKMNPLILCLQYWQIKTVHYGPSGILLLQTIILRISVKNLFFYINTDQYMNPPVQMSD